MKLSPNHLADWFLAVFFLVLQHASTPNSIVAPVAWQLEDGVHAFTVKVKPAVKADVCFNRRGDLLRGAVKITWKGTDKPACMDRA